MAIPSTVLRETPMAFRTSISADFLNAYRSPAVERLGFATQQIDKATVSSVGGWGAAPQVQVERAISALNDLPKLQSTTAGEQSTFARELLGNVMAGRQGNASEVLDFRRAALIQARTAVSSAAQQETTALLRATLAAKEPAPVFHRPHGMPLNFEVMVP